VVVAPAEVAMADVATDPSVEAACQALLRWTSRVADVLGRLREPGAGAIGVWSVAETAAHLALSAPYFLRVAQGLVPAEEVEDLDDNAAATVAAVRAEPERDLAKLAERILGNERRLVDQARHSTGDPLVSPFCRTSMPLSAMLGVELGELVVHGRDLARAAGLPWPIEPADAALALAGGLHCLPAMLDRERAAERRLRCQVHIRHGISAVVVIDRGELHLEEPPQRVDCHLTVEPVTFLLLMFGRVGQARAVLSGAMIPWGRRPWRVAELQAAIKGV
jgi:uncharacterized protein (TIGR03083 family)